MPIRYVADHLVASVLSGAVHRSGGGANADLFSRSEVFAGVSPGSLGLSLERWVSGPGQLVVVLPYFGSGSVYAGVRTALMAAAEMSAELQCAVRFMVDGVRGDAVSVRRIANTIEMVVPALAGRFEVYPLEYGGRLFWREADVFVVTYWTTAVAAWAAVVAGRLDPTRVIYLIQDYEPDFLPASSARELARSTYEQGFLHVVNSRPLAQSLARANIPVDPALVFSPAFDYERLAGVASARERYRGEAVSVLLYGRPSKPRNMFEMAIAGLRSAAQSMDAGISVVFASAGEKHPDVRLAETTILRSLGNVGWDGYYRLLGESDVVLSLQASAHPSHPPLEAAVAGCYAVTNRFGETRDHLHPRLYAAEGNPIDIGQALKNAIAASLGGSSAYMPIDASLLGRPLMDVARWAAQLVAGGHAFR